MSLLSTGSILLDSTFKVDSGIGWPPMVNVLELTLEWTSGEGIDKVDP
jgi:hypothetical protein